MTRADWAKAVAAGLGIGGAFAAMFALIAWLLIDAYNAGAFR